MPITSSGITCRTIRGGPIVGRGGSGGASGPTLLVFDSFTNNTGSGILLVDRDPDTSLLGRWQETGADECVVDNTIDAVKHNGTTDDCAYFDGFANLPVIAEVQPPSIRADYAARYVDKSNYFLLIIDPGGKLQLLSRVGGTFTSIANLTVTFTKGWFSDSGTEIKVGKDREAALITHSSTTHNSSALLGLRKIATDGQRTTEFQLVGGSDNPADLENLP